MENTVKAQRLLTVKTQDMMDLYDLLFKFEIRVKSWSDNWKEDIRFDWFKNVFEARELIRKNILRESKSFTINSDVILYCYMATQYMYVDRVVCGDFVKVCGDDFTVFTESETNAVQLCNMEFESRKHSYVQIHGFNPSINESIKGALLLINQGFEKVK